MDLLLNRKNEKNEKTKKYTKCVIKIEKLIKEIESLDIANKKPSCIRIKIITHMRKARMDTKIDLAEKYLAELKTIIDEYYDNSILFDTRGIIYNTMMESHTELSKKLNVYIQDRYPTIYIDLKGFENLP